MTTLQESGFLTKIDTKTCCCCVISAHVRETRRSPGVLGAGLVALVRKFIRNHEKVALEDANPTLGVDKSRSRESAFGS
jgi:hypothetical protein